MQTPNSDKIINVMIVVALQKKNIELRARMMKGEIDLHFDWIRSIELACICDPLLQKGYKVGGADTSYCNKAKK